ncbi:MAG: aldehyde dehydrogenase family protein [Pseudomonadota bacterium]
MTHLPFIIAGQPVDSKDTFEVVNPATGQPFATAPVATPEDLDRAVAAARTAFKSWSFLPVQTRREAILAIGNKIAANGELLANLITREQGKPLGGFARLGSRFEVDVAAKWCEATAQMEMPPDVLMDGEQGRIELHRKPIGVVGSITPWNWPLMIAIWHIIPAIYAGNAVVIKPSSLTPLATLKLVELANEVLPAGVLNIVSGEGGLGRAMASHAGIDKIVFTGSTQTGKSIMAGAAETLKRLTLELGGNDAGIVLPGANISEIAPQIFGGAFINNGQTCAALKRLYVHDSQYDDMCGALASIAKSVTVGDGLDDGTDFGPVQNASQLAFVANLAQQAQRDGGQFLTGGTSPLQDNGYFFAPTIVAGLCDGHALVDEEPFGPILPVIRYSDEQDVLARSNENPNGLGGSVWSADIEHAKVIAAQMECGTVWINGHGGLNPFAPFGGVKQSGFGVEFGVEGLKECTLPQTIHLPAST